MGRGEGSTGEDQRKNNFLTEPKEKVKKRTEMLFVVGWNDK